MVGDGSELRIGEAAERLNVSKSAARMYALDHLLRWHRTVGGHRRIDAASVDELAEVLRMPDGGEREMALDALRRRNAAGR